MVTSVYFADHSIEAEHGRRSLRAGAVVLTARTLITAIQLLSFMALARLLSPEDYGLVSMVTAITVFAPLLVSLGTPDAVIQRPRITEGEISFLFWISFALGLSVAALMAVSGPLIARFYGEPRLTSITLVSALTFVAAALSCQHTTLLRRAMKFKDIALVEIGANLISASAAIAMALYGFGYWALVLRPVLLTSSITVGAWLMCSWIPSRPSATREAKQILRQGLHGAGFLVTDYIAGSSDRVAIGHQSGPVALGYYQNAMFIYENLCALLVLSAHNVAVASLVKAQRDINELRRLWGKALLTLEFYAMPAFGVLAVTGRDLIPLLFGNKWSYSGTLVSIIALRGIPHAVERTMGWLHVTAGRNDRWLRWGFISLSAQLIALFAGLPYGPQGVAVAFVVCTFVLFIPAIAYSGRPLGIKMRDVVAVIWRPLVASLVAVAIGFFVRYTVLTNYPIIFRIIVLGTVYMITYLIAVVWILGEDVPIRVLVGLVYEWSPKKIMNRVGISRLFGKRNAS